MTSSIDVVSFEPLAPLGRINLALCPGLPSSCAHMTSPLRSCPPPQGSRIAAARIRRQGPVSAFGSKSENRRNKPAIHHNRVRLKPSAAKQSRVVEMTNAGNAETHDKCHGDHGARDTANEGSLVG